MDLDQPALHFDYVRLLKQTHPAIKMLNADNMPLIVSFLYRAFLVSNERSIEAETLTTKLDDYLYHLRQTYGEEQYPQNAKFYLNEWSTSDNNYLRKYYPRGSDEPVYDLTPATESLMEWLQSLQQKSFVGTESRLLIILQILHDIANQTELDPQRRIATLEKQKQAIEQEINDIQQGVVTTYNATQIKERFMEAENTAKKLLSDFRQVEYNFRILDQQTREKIAASNKTKGKVLAEVFADHDVIRESDQGRSFSAFWEFLMSPQRQQELSVLLENVYELEEIQALTPNDFLKRIHYSLLEAGEKVYNTHVELAEQLRRYLDDQVYLENKRLMTLIHRIEKQFINIKQNNALLDTFSISLPALSADINLLMSRDLFNVPKNPVITDQPDEISDPTVDLTALFEQTYVDENQLKRQIDYCLQQQSQVSLKEIAEQFPIEKGMAELATYFKIASNADNASFVAEHTEQLWITAMSGYYKRVCIPKILFVAQPQQIAEQQ